MRVYVARIIGMADEGLAAVLNGAVFPRSGRLLNIGLFGVDDRIELGSADLFEGDGSSLRAFVPFLVGARMNAGMTGELVRARKALLAVGEGAHVGLLAGMGSNMTSLVLESIERTGA